MKKKICIVLSFILAGALVLLGGCGGDKKSESGQGTAVSGETVSNEGGSSAFTSEKEENAPSDSEEEENQTLVYNAELVEYFTGMRNGNALYVNRKATVKMTSDLKGTIVGEKDAGEIVIDGGEEGATLTATGGGVGAIQPAEGCTLVFKNITVQDSSIISPTTEDRREGYLEFGGKLRFENCTFSCAAYLCDDADAAFIGCKFNSGAQNMYAMWISDGSASFKDCTFEGWRAIKLYEGSDNRYTSVQDHYDVESVVIEDCLFDHLQKKPGIAIDVFAGKETSITIKDSEFDGCQEGDGVDCIDGVYESDVDTSTLTFTMEGVIVDGYTCEWEDRVTA